MQSKFPAKNPKSLRIGRGNRGDENFRVQPKKYMIRPISIGITHFKLWSLKEKAFHSSGNTKWNTHGVALWEM